MDPVQVAGTYSGPRVPVHAKYVISAHSLGWELVRNGESQAPSHTE